MKLDRERVGSVTRWVIADDVPTRNQKQPVVASEEKARRPGRSLVAEKSPDRDNGQ
jgi:hypothetical protein